MRGIIQAGSEFFDRRLMGECCLRTEISDRHRLLQRERAGHDLTINRPQRFIGDRPFIRLANPFNDRQFAMRRVNFLPTRHFQRANFEHMPCPFVQKSDDFFVEPVDRLPMFLKAHYRGSSPSGLPVSVRGASLPAGETAEDCVAVPTSTTGGVSASPAGCSWPPVGAPSTVNNDSGLITGIRRSSSAAGSSSRFLSPKYSRNKGVVV